MSGSNQVYSNDKNKYYDYPGLNTYLLTADTSSIPPSIIPTYIYFNGFIGPATNDPGCVSVTNTSINIIRDGMYCFALQIAISSLSLGTQTDLTADLYMNLTRPGEFADLIIQRDRQRYVRDGAATIDIHIIPLTICMYLKRNDSIKILIVNAGLAGENFKVLSSQSLLTINKIN